jgi:integral membrane protein (TIGR01906 family)
MAVSSRRKKKKSQSRQRTIRKSSENLILILLIINIPLIAYLGAARVAILNEAYITENTDNSTDALLTVDYMLGKHDSLPEEFNEREVSHMQDVRDLTRNVSIYFYTAIAVLIATIIFWLCAKDYSRIIILLTGGAIATTVFTLILLISFLNFNHFFNLLHAPFFEGGSWMFEANDYLINIFPLSFFRKALTVIALDSVVFTWTSVVIVRCLKLVAKK